MYSVLLVEVATDMGFHSLSVGSAEVQVEEVIAIAVLLRHAEELDGEAVGTWQAEGVHSCFAACLRLA